MGKDKKPEAANPAHSKPEAKPAAPQHGAGAPHAGHGAPSGGSSAQSKGNVGAKVGCQAVACKAKDTRFNFCDEHFRQYKFGLIKKSGEVVSDFEKKFEHYQHWLKAQKVA